MSDLEARGMGSDREAGPLERVLEQAIVQLSEHPEGTRDLIRSRSGMIADAMKKTLENANATIVERWAALADEYFELVLVHLAFVSEVGELDRLLFEEAAAAAIRAARNLDQASIALTHGDSKTFQTSVEAVEAELGVT
jgi:hypothetical protein